MTESLIVDAKNVSVIYRLTEYKSHSFKEWVFNRLKGRSAGRDFVAVDNVSFRLKRGESLALVGHNGSGKSTLLRAIAGVIPSAQKSSIVVSGRIAPMIELGAGFDGELSGRENIYLSCLILGLSYREIDGLVESIIDFSELRKFIDVPVKNYSSRMYARLGFACATAVKPDLIIVDEVLAVGDSNFSAKCLNRINQLRSSGTSVLLVSHDEGSVRQFCDRALVMNEGKAIFDGDVETALRLHRDVMAARAIAAQ